MNDQNDGPVNSFTQLLRRGSTIKTVLPSRTTQTTAAPAGVPVNAASGRGGRVLSIGLNSSQPDAYSIVTILQKLSIQFARQPMIREFTVNEVLCSVADNDLDNQLQTVISFVKDQLAYTRDPVGSEYVISPVVMIQQLKAGQHPAGDCDDHVLLLNSMLGSIGFQTKVVGVKLNGSPTFNHVISSVLYDGKWLDVDPVAKEVEAPVYTDRLVVA